MQLLYLPCGHNDGSVSVIVENRTGRYMSSCNYNNINEYRQSFSNAVCTYSFSHLVFLLCTSGAVRTSILRNCYASAISSELTLTMGKV